MPAAYVPPNRRHNSRLQGAGLSIKRVARFDLDKQAAAFPVLGAPKSTTQSGRAPAPALESFLSLAAKRTEKIRRRGRPAEKKSKCPIGWVTLPVRVQDAQPDAQPDTQVAAPRVPAWKYRRAAADMLNQIQLRRDLETEVLGPDSPWLETPHVWDRLTHEDDSELDYWSEDESSSESEDEDPEAS